MRSDKVQTSISYVDILFLYHVTTPKSFLSASHIRLIGHVIYEMYILVFLFRYFIVSYAIAFNSIILFFMGGCVANKSAHQPS